MAYRKPDPLYGAPRGNRVMKQKRVSGLSAHKQLRIHVACEKCSVRGCANPVLATRTHTGVQKDRYCVEHVSTRKAENFNVRDLLKLPWEV